MVRIEEEALARLVNLTSLGLANNPLPQSTLSGALGRIGRGNWTRADADVEVEEFDGQRCPTSDSQLVRLDISEVILSNLTVDALGGFSRLVVLDASFSELQRVEPQLFDCLPDIETLHLEGMNTGGSAGCWLGGQCTLAA